MSVFDNEAYRDEGRCAAARGDAKHTNPYDYRYATLAANAWDEGWCDVTERKGKQ